MADISFSLKYVSVYITASDHKEAEHIAEEVVKRRLAACANIVENISSIYWWEGEIHRDQEALMFLKSRIEKVKELIRFVKSIHSYDNPAIVVFPILDGSTDYFKWIDEEVR